MSVLFFNTLRLNLKFPRDPSSDRFILSKGHSAPILYAAWAEAGLFPVEDLQNLRKIDSDLEGHPTPRLNFIDVGTGSLGQGVAVAAGMAYVGKNYDKADYRYVGKNFFYLESGIHVCSLCFNAEPTLWLVMVNLLKVRFGNRYTLLVTTNWIICVLFLM